VGVSVGDRYRAMPEKGAHLHQQNARTHQLRRMRTLRFPLSWQNTQRLALGYGALTRHRF
jgi:hypothetical protein